MSGVTQISFQGYVSCGGGDDDDATGDMQTSERMMDRNLTSEKVGGWMDDNGGKVNLQHYT